MNIAVANHQRTKKINSRLLKQIVAALLAELKIEGAELGIHLVGAREMARVNWQFLKHEGSTDVIAFDHNETDRPPSPAGACPSPVGTGEGGRRPDEGRGKETISCGEGRGEVPSLLRGRRSASAARASRSILHGEIFICMDDAIAQAKEFKTTWQSEVVRYIVHGVLHLLGHDDLQPDLRRKMKREENRLVRQLKKAFSLAQL